MRKARRNGAESGELKITLYLQGQSGLSFNCLKKKGKDLGNPRVQRRIALVGRAGANVRSKVAAGTAISWR